MLIRPPTDEEAREIIAKVYAARGIRLVDKRHDAVSQALAWALGELRGAGLDVPTAEGFLRDYATTLPSLDPAFVAVVGWPGDPAEIGAGDLGRCCHEATHAEQIARDGAPAFVLAYLASRTARALYEAHACGAADELRLAMGEALPAPAAEAERFRPYLLGDRQIALIAGVLRSVRATLGAGVSCYGVAREMVEALRARGCVA